MSGAGNKGELHCSLIFLLDKMNTQGCHVLGTVKEMCSLEERKLRERTKRLSVFEIEQGSKGRSNERLAVSCYSRVAVGAGEILLVFNYSDTLLFFR